MLLAWFYFRIPLIFVWVKSYELYANIWRDPIQGPVRLAEVQNGGPESGSITPRSAITRAISTQLESWLSRSELVREQKHISARSVFLTFILLEAKTAVLAKVAFLALHLFSFMGAING
jgi:hypothetical protein